MGRGRASHVRHQRWLFGLVLYVEGARYQRLHSRMADLNVLCMACPDRLRAALLDVVASGLLPILLTFGGRIFPVVWTARCRTCRVSLQTERLLIDRLHPLDRTTGLIGHPCSRSHPLENSASIGASAVEAPSRRVAPDQPLTGR